nr:hypothetical protein MarFTME_257 [Marseillevirus futianmevirus]
MQNFFHNREYLNFCLNDRTPSVKEQKKRFLETRRYIVYVAPERIGIELLKEIVDDLSRKERSSLLRSSCEKEDIRKFGILTFGMGDTDYISENDEKLFSLSEHFYSEMFDRGMLDTDRLVERAEGSGLDISNVAYLLSWMLKAQARKQLERE